MFSYSLCTRNMHNEIKFDKPVIIYIGHKAYNVTPYITKHPGGILAIWSKNGTDVANDYKWHTSNTQKIWESYRAPLYDKYSQKKECVIL